VKWLAHHIGPSPFLCNLRYTPLSFNPIPSQIFSLTGPVVASCARGWHADHVVPVAQQTAQLKMGVKSVMCDRVALGVLYAIGEVERCGADMADPPG